MVPTFKLQNNNRQILKAFSLEDKYIKFINEKHEGTSLHDSNFNLFKFVDNLQNQLPSSYENYNFVKRFETVIIISKNVENILASIPLDININQKMFFLDKDTFNLFEAYTINSRKVMQNIGHIRSKDFVWRNGIEPHFEYRRSNFKGTIFKVMTENHGTNIKLDKHYKHKAPFYPQNQTYLVNGFVQGLYFDILTELEHKLNFSTLIFKRKVESWGFVYEQTNGTYHGSGMVGDIFHKKADLVVTGLTMTLDRAQHIDFMIPISPYNLGLVVPSSDSKEEFDFDMFLIPIKLDLWMAAAVVAFIIAIFRSFTASFYISSTSIRFHTFLWESFIAYFGGVPTESQKIAKFQSQKIVMFTSLLCGLFFWMAYRSSLTSELSLSIQKHPFENLESFLMTNWK